MKKKRDHVEPAPADKVEKTQILIRPAKSIGDKLRALADESMGPGSSLSAYCVHVLTQHVNRKVRQ